MSRAWLGLGLALIAGCRAQPSAADPRPCAPTPTTATLPADASAGALAGEYRLQLVATKGESSGATASGTLSLLPATMPDRGESVVLYGAADIDVARIGAVAGDLASRDPSEPGVLVMRLPPTRGADGARILLRLGAEANRRNQLRFDGGYTVLRVRQADGQGFAGAWESGAPMAQAAGHFCAVRAEPAAD